MKIPQSITITFEPVDDGNFCNIEFKVDYECSDKELLKYLEYATEAVRNDLRG
jgi:ribosome-associated toxin RatA of RatAB toxin-antitoxin module